MQKYKTVKIKQLFALKTDLKPSLVKKAS